MVLPVELESEDVDRSESESESESDAPKPTRVDEDEDEDESVSAFSRLPARITAKRAPSSAATLQPKTAQSTGFGALGVSQQLITALSAMSIRQPTDVQTACIPPLLAGP